MKTGVGRASSAAVGSSRPALPQRDLELAGRLGRTEAAVRRRAWGLRAAQLVAADPLVDPGGAGVR